MRFAHWLSDFFGTGRPELRARKHRQQLAPKLPTEVLETRVLLTVPIAREDFLYAASTATAAVVAPGLLRNDFDFDGDPLAAVMNSGAAHGTAVLNSDGSVFYTPGSGYLGTDNFTYRVTDGTHYSELAIVTIDIGDIPGDVLWDARSISAPYHLKRELGGYIGDGANGEFDVDLFSVNLEAGDHLLVDIDADELDDGTDFSEFDSYLRIFDGNGMELASNDDAADPDTLINELDSALRFSPAMSGTYYIGVSGFGNSQYDLWMPGMGSSGSQGEYHLQLTRTPNGVPLAVADSATISNGVSSVVINPLENDSDPESDTLTLYAFSQPPHGTVEVDWHTGNLSYTPSYGFTGIDTFEYTVADPFWGTANGIVTVTVEGGGNGGGGSNSAPFATDDVYTITSGGEAVSLFVLVNDTDPDANPLQITSVDTPQYGSAWILSGYGVEPDSIQFQAMPGAFGTFVFDYTISDGQGGTDTGSITITLNGESGGGNQAPIAADDVFSILQDAAVTELDVLSNDADPNGDVISLQYISQYPQHGNLSIVYDANYQPVELIYEPLPGYSGTDTFRYVIADDEWASAEGLVSIQVGLNHAPVGKNDSYSVISGHILAVSTSQGVLANDSDQDGGTLIAQLVSNVGHGTLSLQSHGGFSYTPDGDFEGVDTFTYEVSDGVESSSPVTVSFNVTKNRAPVAVTDSYAGVTAQALSISPALGVLKNDIDADSDTLTAKLVSGPQHGSVTLNPNGSFTYTSDLGFLGADSFSYQATDGIHASGVVTVNLTLYGGPLWAVGDQYTVGHDRTLSIPAAGVLKNDWDQESDPLTSVLISPTQHGSITLFANGAFNYTPDFNFVGFDTFTYTISDGGQSGNTATATIHVTNRAPVAVDDFFTVFANRVFQPAVSIARNDFDAERDPLTITLADNVAHGTLAIMPDGKFQYTPNVGFIGDDSFSYSVADSMATGSTAKVHLSIRNQAPRAGADQFTLVAGGLLSISSEHGILRNDYDLEGHGLAVAFLESTKHGSLNLNLDGGLTYIPNSGFVGVDTFSYTLSDEMGASSVGEVTIQVTNRTPAAVDDWMSIRRNGIGVLDVLENDWDDDAHAITASVVTSPTHGTVQLQSNGNVTYTPAVDFVGEDSFTYQVTDGYASSTPATVHVRVSNRAPVANDDLYAVHQGQSLNRDSGHGLLANDFDADSDSLYAELVAGPAHGTLTLQSSGAFAYEPEAGFVGDDSFTYRTTDGSAESSIGSVTLSVRNTVPLGVQDQFHIGHDRVLVVTESVLGNDMDLDGDSLIAQLVQGPTHGKLTFQADGTFAYTPNGKYVGSDQFSYRANDGAAVSTSVTVSIEIENSAPSGLGRTEAMHQGQKLEVAAPGLLAGAIDADGDTLSISVTKAAAYGTLTIEPTGAFTYVPQPGFSGTDSVLLTLHDGIATSTPLTLTIAVNNHAPVVSDDSLAISHDRTLVGDVLLNDVDVDEDSLSVSLITAPQKGTLTLQVNGKFSYVPQSGYVGSDSFTYRISDGAETADGVASIDITNAAPQTEFDYWGLLSGQTLQLSAVDGVLKNDTDADSDALSVKVESQTQHGKLTLNADGSVTYVPDAGFVGTDAFSYVASDGVSKSAAQAVLLRVYDQTLVAESDRLQVTHDRAVVLNPLANDFNATGSAAVIQVESTPNHGSVLIGNDGTVTYTPDVGFVGSDEFSYRLVVGLQASPVATFELQVLNRTPVVIPFNATVIHDQVLTMNADVGLLNVAIDQDHDVLTVSLVGQPLHGTVTFNADGSFVYVPDEGFVGEDTFEFVATDGVAISAPQIATISVTNETLTVDDVDFAVHIDQTLTGDVLVVEVDEDDDAISVLLVTGPQHGVLTLNVDGAFEYIPDTSYRGTDSFTFRVTDGLSESDLTTTSIQVFNGIPFAREERLTLRHDTPLSGNVLANDADPDGDPLNVLLVSNVSHGSLTLNGDGSFDYQPGAGYFGADEFSYRVLDVWDQSAITTVSLNITNQIPLANRDRRVLLRGNAITLTSDDLLRNDLDGDGDALVVLTPTNPNHGTLVSNGPGQWIYTPETKFAGLDSFTYRISDGISESLPAVFELDVLNREPTAADDEYFVLHDRSFSSGTASVLDNDFDGNGDVLSVELVTNVAHGTLALQTDGKFAYTPTAGYVGQDEFRYRVTDGIVTSRPVVVTIDVRNSVPIAATNRFRVVHDQQLVVSAATGLTATAVESDGDELTVQVIAEPQFGKLTVAADGSFAYQPQPGFSGNDTFVYAISDGVKTSAAELIMIDVRNTQPAVTPDVVEIEPGETSVSFTVADLLQNDADFEHDKLALTVLDAPARGTLARSGDSFTYTVDGSWPGDVSFTYEVSDGASSGVGQVRLQQTGSLSGGVAWGSNGTPITVAPMAVSDRYTVSRNDALEVGWGEGLLSNDSAPAGGDLQVEILTSPTKGSFASNADGEFVFIPNGDWVGTDTFTYRVSDGTRTGNTATVSITITNAAPRMTSQVLSIHQGSTLTVGVSDLAASATDADGDDLTFSAIGSTANGKLTQNGDGSFTYTPNAGFVGVDRFTVRASDGLVSSNSASVVINVTNTQPVSRTQTYRGHHGEKLSIPASGVLAMSSDLDGDKLTAKLHGSAPTGGTLTMREDGSFDFLPNGTFVGTTSFQYVTHDGAEASSPATITLDIANSKPDGADATYSVHHGQPLQIIAPAFDADGDALELAITAGPTLGSLTTTPISTSNSNTRGPFSYLAGHTLGTDKVKYKVWDGAEWSSEHTLSISITNSQPFAMGPTRFVRPGQTVSIPDLRQYAADGDGDSLAMSTGSTGTKLPASSGSYDLSSSGGFTYTAGTTPGTVLIPFRVSDGAQDSNVANVTIEVVNTPPVAFNRSFTFHFSEKENDYSQQSVGAKGYAMQLSAGIGSAYDSDDDSLTFSLAGSPSQGSATVSSTGNLFYTPPTDDFIGTVTIPFRTHDGFTNGNIAQVTLTITNNAPVTLTDRFTTTHGKSFVITPSSLLANDLDIDGDDVTLEVDIASLTSRTVRIGNGPGSLTPQVVNGETLGWEYNPGSTDYVGQSQFRYRVSDGNLKSSWTNVTIDVVNHKPSGVDRAFAGWKGTTVQSDGSITPGATIYKISNLKLDHIIDLDGDVMNSKLVGSAPGGFILNQDGSFSYTFDDQGHTVQYQIYDGAEWSDPITVDLMGYDTPPIVLPTGPTSASNNPPYAFPDGTYDADRHQPIWGKYPSVLKNDLDLDGDQLHIVDLTVYSTVHPTVSPASLTFGPDGSFTFKNSVPGTYIFPYTMTDGEYQVSSELGILVDNQPPTSQAPHYFKIPVRKPTGDYLPPPHYVVINKIDPDGDPVTLDPLPVLASGTFSIYDIGPGWYIWYTPNVGFTGTESVTITYHDDLGLCGSTPYNIAVTDDPNFHWDVLIARGEVGSWIDHPVTLNVLENDYSIDSDGGALRIVSYTPSDPNDTWGVDTTTGQVTFIPSNPDKFADEGASLEYTISNERGNTATAKIQMGTGGMRLMAPDYNNGFAPTQIWLGNNGKLKHREAPRILTDVVGAGGGGADQWVSKGLPSAFVVSGSAIDATPSPAKNSYLNLTAGSVWYAEAGILVVEAAGSIDHIKASIIARAGAGNSIGQVTALGNAYELRTNGTIAGPITALGSLGKLQARNIAATISSLGSIYYISATENISGSISALGGIGYDSLTRTMGERGIIAGGSISAPISALGDIYRVQAGGTIAGNISAIGNLELLRAGGSLTSVVSVTGRITDIWIGHDTSAASVIHALGLLPQIYVGKSLLGLVHAEHGSIGTIRVGEVLAGEIKAKVAIQRIEVGLYVSATAAQGSIISPSITADQITFVMSYGSIGNGSPGQTNIVAKDIGFIEARTFLRATIDATDLSIGSIISGETTSGGWNVVAGLPGDMDIIAHAKKSIGRVGNASGSIFGSITADLGSVGSVYAQDKIDATISALKGIQRVVATESDIQGSVTSTSGAIGLVSTGGNLSAPVKADRSIRKIVTNTTHRSGGEISGKIEAGDDIGAVIITVPDFWSGTSSTMSLTLGSVSQLQATAAAVGSGSGSGASASSINKPNKPVLPSISGASLKAEIKAGGGIGGVFSAGDITKNIESANGIGLVHALHDVVGNLTATGGDIVATAWGAFQGAVNAPGAIVAGSYGPFSGAVTSKSDVAHVTTWDLLTGNVKGAGDVNVFAYEGIANSTQSLQGRLALGGFGDIKGTFTGKQTAAMATLGEFNGTFISHDESALTAALGNITGTINAKNEAVITSLKDIQAGITSASAHVEGDNVNANVLGNVSNGGNFIGSVSVYAHQKFSGNITSPFDIYIDAGEISGAFIKTPQRIGINAFGVSPSGNAMSGFATLGAKEVVIRARGSVTSGAIKSNGGRVSVFADGRVDATIEAMKSVDVGTWGSLTGSVNSKQGSAFVFAYGDLNATVDAKSHIDVTTWGASIGKVSADNGHVDLFARRDVIGDVTSKEGDVTLYSGGMVIGEINAGAKIGATRGNANLTTHGDVLGNVTAKQSAWVDSFGKVSGDVTGELSKASIIALKDISSKLTAGTDATAVAWGNVTSPTIKAGSAVQVVGHAGVNGVTTTASTTTRILSDNDATGVTITAGGKSATVAALNDVSSLSVSGTQDVKIFAGGDASNLSVTATGSISLFALGSVDGTTKAGTNLDVTSFGSISSFNGDAKNGEAWVFADGDLQGTVNATLNMTIVGTGKIDGIFDAKGAGEVLALDSFKGTA